MGTIQCHKPRSTILVLKMYVLFHVLVNLVLPYLGCSSPLNVMLSTSKVVFSYCGTNPQNCTSHIMSLLLLVVVIFLYLFPLDLQYVFTTYNKPFFSTFAKTSMFVLYLFGFVVWKPWRQQCTRGFRGRHAAFVSVF